ncbi:uncharacterized protein ACNLHF_026746 [Anomaloglossus baeobatrachus]|uniref:uncharacterized protein LOC142246585 n=1 Tax=Anomaloglossus baeobatrachus TaxID=238106 RepID=UPI003F4F71A7
MVLVGVFSREDESSYRWLVDVLVSSRCMDDVRCVTITNTFQKFMEETDKCDFAILYHSKKRGRVNVTNVVDSLYDDELQYLHNVYGRNNVLVVIDDLDISSEEEKSRILNHQPSIGEFALDLFIFSSNDKANLYRRANQSLEEMKRIIRGARRRGGNVHGTEHRTEASADARGTRANRCCMISIIVAIAIAGIILIIVLSTSHHQSSGHHSTGATTHRAIIKNISNLTTAPYVHR